MSDMSDISGVFCYKCEHYRWSGGYLACAALHLVDVVDGAEILHGAAAMRQPGRPCGPSAKLFVQKKPWWKFWSK